MKSLKEFGERMRKKNEFKPLKQLSELMSDNDIMRCSCGSPTFFDWGIQLITTTEKFASPRYADMAFTDGVKVCAECRKPVVMHSGDLYDASEYVDKNVIDRLITWSQDKKVKAPIRAQDP